MSDDVQSFNNVPVMVLGGTGFIGRWVARALSGIGAVVTLAVRREAVAQALISQYGINAKVECVDLDYNLAALEVLIKRVKPTVVFNLAGYGVDRSERDERTAYAINSELPAKLCEWLSGEDSEWPGCRLVHVGSALEYGELDNDLNEDSVPRPGTLYGVSKLQGTERITDFCKQYGLHALTARLFTVYGCGEHAGRLLPALVEAARHDADVPLTEGLQQRDFCFVEDVAEGLIRLAAAPYAGHSVVNLASGQLHSVRAFVETAASALHIPAERLQFGALPVRSEEMAHKPVANDRLQQMINWVPSGDLDKGIRRSLAFEAALDGTR